MTQYAISLYWLKHGSKAARERWRSTKFPVTESQRDYILSVWDLYDTIIQETKRKKQEAADLPDGWVDGTGA